MTFTSHQHCITLGAQKCYLTTRSSVKKNKAITHIDRLILVMFYLLKANPSYTNKGPSSQGYGFFSSHVWM